MVKQWNPENERKRAWLNPGRSTPTGTHSDRVADSVQRITALTIPEDYSNED